MASADPAVQQRIIDCLKDGMRRAVQEHEQEIFFIKPGATGEWTPEYIFDIKQKIVAEIGTKQHRIHIHSTIEVKHNTLIQMNGKALRDLLLDYCKDDAIKNLFVRIRFIRADLSDLYLEKMPA